MAERLTPEQEAEIRARWSQAGLVTFSQPHDDVRRLLAEIERLRGVMKEVRSHVAAERRLSACLILDCEIVT